MAREQETRQTPDQAVKEEILKHFDPEESLRLARQLALQYAEAEIQLATAPGVREEWERARTKALEGWWGNLRANLRSEGSRHEDEKYGASLIMLADILKDF